FQAEDGIRDRNVTGVQTCALPIWQGGIGVHDVSALIRLMDENHLAEIEIESHGSKIRLVKDRLHGHGSVNSVATEPPPAPGAPEIGRASCRERVEGGVADG